MFHQKRFWWVKNIPTAEELVQELKTYTWTRCAGFRWSGYLFLNDSFSEDGAQEYGVVKEFLLTRGEARSQVDSITVSWMTPERLMQYLVELPNLTDDLFLSCINPDQIQTPAEHGRCGHCA